MTSLVKRSKGLMRVGTIITGSKIDKRFSFTVVSDMTSYHEEPKTELPFRIERTLGTTFKSSSSQIARNREMLDTLSLHTT